MAVCAMLTAMAAERSLCVSSCPLAGVTNRQASPSPAQHAEILLLRVARDAVGGPPGMPIPFHPVCTASIPPGHGAVAAVAAFRPTQATVSGFACARPIWYAGGGRRQEREAMSARRILVTGGSGFLGSALVKALVRRGEAVRVFDDNSRGALRRLREVERDVEFVNADIRDAAAVDDAMRGIDEVHHLAFVNGTATFYSAPHLV